MATNSPSTRRTDSSPVCGVAQPHALDLGSAEDLLDDGVHVQLDLGVGERAVLHDLAAAELIATVEQVDLRREPRQEDRLFQGRVAAADDGDLLVAEEEAVAGRAGADAAAAQPRLALEAQPQRRCAGRHDHRFRRGTPCRAPRAGTGRCEKSTRSTSTSTICGAEALRLGAELGHELRALDAVRKARVVLDVARDHQLAARRRTGEHDGLEVGARGVDGGREPGRPGPDDDDLGFVRPAADRNRRARRTPGRARRTNAIGATAVAIGTAPMSLLKSMDDAAERVDAVGVERAREATASVERDGLGSAAIPLPARRRRSVLRGRVIARPRLGAHDVILAAHGYSPGVFASRALTGPAAAGRPRGRAARGGPVRRGPARARMMCWAPASASSPKRSTTSAGVSACAAGRPAEPDVLERRALDLVERPADRLAVPPQHLVLVVDLDGAAEDVRGVARTGRRGAASSARRRRRS